MDTGEALIWLCGSAVRNEALQKETALTIDVDALFELASKHMLSAITGMSLQKAGIEDSRFKKAMSVALYKSVIMDVEKEKIFQRMDALDVWHVALKGAELKEYYPSPSMRECADLDVLFDAQREEEVRELMLSLGYECQSFGGGHHDVYVKSSGLCVEMHVALFGVEYGDYLNQFFGNVKDRLLRGQGWEFHFTPEDFYLYFIAHNHNHFASDGVGVRALLDTYVFLDSQASRIDWQYVNAQLEKLGLGDFEREFRELSLKCFSRDAFSRDELTEKERTTLNYVLASGSHGLIENRVENGIRAAGGGFIGKVRYAWSRLILPMDVVKHSFPYFYKHKILLPFLPLYRAYRGITGNKKKINAEWKAFRR